MTRERAQSFLEEKHIEQIAQAYAAFEDAEGFAKVATLDEIRANDANMSIARYVTQGERRSNGERGSAARGVAQRVAVQQLELRESMEQFFQTLEEAGVGR